MNSEAAGVTRTIPESCDKSVAQIRRLLASAGFSIVEEFDLSRESYFELGIANRSCVVLLVDTPLLLFTAIVLDRSAAAFLPFHVVIAGDRDISYVHWANPVTSSGLRPPAPARAALDEAYHRIAKTLSKLPQLVEFNRADRVISTSP